MSTKTVSTAYLECLQNSLHELDAKVQKKDQTICELQADIDAMAYHLGCNQGHIATLQKQVSEIEPKLSGIQYVLIQRLKDGRKTVDIKELLEILQ